jgi:penicillin-binding protein 1A
VDGFDLGPAGAAAPAATTSKPATQPSAAPQPVDPDILVAPRAIDPRVAWQLQSMMRDVVKRGTATAARVLNREDVGGKTGSTNDHRDAWFSGFGGPFVTTVWVGRDDFRSLGYREYGGKAALPIWINYMQAALKDQPERLPDPPAGMVKVSVSPGGRLLPGGDGGIVEWVKAEDLQRMEEESLAEPELEEQPAEESFDIF